jgi:hypothetical protein
MSTPNSIETSPEATLPELTPEQIEIGKEIAEICGFDDKILEQDMLWNGHVRPVGYGLAHSAHHIEELELTARQIQEAVLAGIEAYQQSQINADRPV